MADRTMRSPASAPTQGTGIDVENVRQQVSDAARAGASELEPRRAAAPSGPALSAAGAAEVRRIVNLLRSSNRPESREAADAIETSVFGPIPGV